MEEPQIRSMVRELDEAIPRDGAIAQFRIYTSHDDPQEDPHECEIRANRLGFLRLGVEFLKGAFAAPIPRQRGKLDRRVLWDLRREDALEASDQFAIHVDLDYMLDRNTNMVLDWFERREDLVCAPAAVERRSWLSSLLGWGWVVAMLAVLALALVGLVQVVRWVLG